MQIIAKMVNVFFIPVKFNIKTFLNRQVEKRIMKMLILTIKNFVLIKLYYIKK